MNDDTSLPNKTECKKGKGGPTSLPSVTQTQVYECHWGGGTVTGGLSAFTTPPATSSRSSRFSVDSIFACTCSAHACKIMNIATHQRGRRRGGRRAQGRTHTRAAHSTHLIKLRQDSLHLRRPIPLCQECFQFRHELGACGTVGGRLECGERLGNRHRLWRHHLRRRPQRQPGWEAHVCVCAYHDIRGPADDGVGGEEGVERGGVHLMETGGALSGPVCSPLSLRLDQEINISNVQRRRCFIFLFHAYHETKEV